MVSLRPPWTAVAAGKAASAVAGDQCLPQRPADQALHATHVEGPAGAVEHDRQEAAVARQAAGGLRGDPVAVVECAGTEFRRRTS
jgi:hypothetical protein